MEEYPLFLHAMGWAATVFLLVITVKIWRLK
jgi:hypothetical protein